jgi:glycosyltransferase involved in cell wall biosynthesis
VSGDPPRRSSLGPRIRRPCVVGPYPPPTHGMAVVTQAMHEALVQAGHRPVAIDIAGFSLARDWPRRALRLPRVVIGLFRMTWHLLTRRSDTLYLAVSGGLGKVYDFGFIVIARIFGARIVLHHHSFAYADRVTSLASATMRMAGGGATHIALCIEHMRRLQASYGVVREILVLSNACVVTDEYDSPPPLKHEVRRIGFLGNVSYEKGILEFFSTVRRLREERLDVQAIVAGPFQDGDVERAVRAQLRILPYVTYAGPTFGVDKSAFFRQIDALLFPSKYGNEAAPLTVYEALSHGVPVVAWGRGCVTEMLLGRGAGWVIPPERDFIEGAVKNITHLHASPEALRKASAAARESFLRARTQAGSELELVLGRLTTAGRERPN